MYIYVHFLSTGRDTSPVAPAWSGGVNRRSTRRRLQAFQLPRHRAQGFIGVSLHAPRSKQYTSPVGSASAGVGSPSSQHRSMKCSCDAMKPTPFPTQLLAERNRSVRPCAMELKTALRQIDADDGSVFHWMPSPPGELCHGTSTLAHCDAVRRRRPPHRPCSEPRAPAPPRSPPAGGRSPRPPSRGTRTGTRVPRPGFGDVGASSAASLGITASRSAWETRADCRRRRAHAPRRGSPPPAG